MLLLLHWQKHQYREPPVQCWRRRSGLRKRPEQKSTRKSYLSHPSVHCHLRHHVRTQAARRVKIRSVPWRFFSAQEQNLQGHYRILLHKWVSSTSKIFFHLSCQTIGCSSPGLRQNQKDFSNLLPWFWSYCHQRKTFSISIIHYYIIFSNYAWNYTECSRWNKVDFGPI